MARSMACQQNRWGFGVKVCCGLMRESTDDPVRPVHLQWSRTYKLSESVHTVHRSQTFS